MDPKHPASEIPPPGARVHEPGRISATVSQYCSRTVFDPERTIDGLIERETAETMPAPAADPDRATLPPGHDPIDLPGNLDMVARIEEGLDERFKQIQEFIHEQLGAMTGALRAVAAETSRANHALQRLQVLEADVESLKARCPHCLMPREGNGASLPPVT